MASTVATWFRARQGLIGLAAILALAIIVLGLFVQAELASTDGQLGAPLDDAWIHFQFARNLSQGNGFSFNPAEPTPGSTAPLWTLMLAGIGLISQEFLVAALGLSALFYLLTIAFSYGLAAELSGRSAIGLVAAVGVMLTGRLVWAGLAGMETTAFAALSVAAVWVYTRKGMTAAAAVLFGLASQTRPEGHALFALAMADTVWTMFRAGRQSDDSHWGLRGLLSRLAPPVLIYALFSLPYMIFSLNQTGRPLPNTFYAKVNTSELFSLRTLRETAVLHWRDNPVAVLLLIPGLVQTWRRSRLVVAWLLLLPVFSAFTVDFVWHHGRYTMPLIPFVMVVAAQGFEWLLARVPARRRAYAAALIVVMLAIGGAWRLPHWAGQLGQNTREILTIDVAMAEWLAENTAPEDLIAVDDIGAIGYLSGRTIFDLNGLISPEMWPILHDEPQGQLRSEATTRLLSEVGPDYLAIFPLWHYEMANNPLVAQEVRRFQSESRTIIGEKEAAVYRSAWPYIAGPAGSGQTPVELGEQIQLLAYALKAPVDKQSQLEVSLTWRSLGPIENSYDVFVHVLDSEGGIVAQADSKPVQGLSPTTRWQPGDMVKDYYLIELPRGLTKGTYQVQVGMYLRETGERLTTTAAVSNENAIYLGSFDW